MDLLRFGLPWNNLGFEVFFRNLLKQAHVEVYEVPKCFMHDLQNFSLFHLLLGLLFKQKVSQCNETGMLHQEMGVVSWVGVFSWKM